jgi:glycosyltransferase involved in cell wall biosynthesis
MLMTPTPDTDDYNSNGIRRALLVIRWPVGGIRTFSRYVYRDFPKDRWHLTILAPDLHEMRVLLKDLAHINVGYMPVKPKPSPTEFFTEVTRQVFRGNFDLIHSHGFTSGVCTAPVALLSRTPHIMTSHDVINEEQFSGRLGALKKCFMGIALSHIDKIHSVSNDAQANLLEHFPSLSANTDCFVLPNGIEVDRFIDTLPRDLRSEYGIGPDVFLIGFMGRFMAQKGFRFLVDAIESLRNEPFLDKDFLVLTFGDDGFIREEIQAIFLRGLNQHFRFLPFTPNIAGTIKGLDCVVMPSLWEACGLLAMEALTCGTPLIGTDCIGLREVLKATPARIVRKADSSTLAEALLQEIRLPSLNSFLNFRDTAKQRFDIRTTSQSLLSMYESMV